MQFPVTIRLRRSLVLSGLLSTSIAAAVVATSFLPAGEAIVGVVGISILGYFARKQLVLENKLFRLEHTGYLTIPQPNGEAVRWELLPGGSASPWLAIFAIANKEKRRRVIVVAFDSTDDDDFRRLRVFLRMRPRRKIEKDDA